MDEWVGQKRWLSDVSWHDDDDDQHSHVRKQSHLINIIYIYYQEFFLLITIIAT